MDKTSLTALLKPHHEPQVLTHRYIANESVIGTGSWIFDNYDFQAWSQERNSYLLLEGRHGTGKTFLCSAVINILQQRQKSAPVLYFYFSQHDQRRSTEDNLLSSLLFQICNLLGTIPTDLSRLCALLLGREPTSELLVRAVEVAMRKLGEFYVVIDAVDKAAHMDRLGKILTNILSWELDGLHMVISCRPPTTFKTLPQPASRVNSHTFDIAEFNGPDIERFIESKLPAPVFGPELGRRFPDKMKLSTLMAIGSDGSFLMSIFFVEVPRRGDNEFRIVETLDALPRELEDLYERWVEKRMKQGGSRELVQNVMIWLCYAQRPLTAEEVAEAVPLNAVGLPLSTAWRDVVTPQSVSEICPELTNNRIIHTVNSHYTAITVTHDKAKQFIQAMLSIDNPHIGLGQACLKYLRRLDRPNSVNSREYGKHFPLAAYAARFWHCHMKIADDSTAQLGRRRQRRELEPLIDAATDFFGGSGSGSGNLCVRNWVKLFDPDRPWVLEPQISNKLPKIAAPLYYASRLGLTCLVLTLLERKDGYDIDDEAGTHGTALQAAAYHGNVEIVKSLLEFGADPSIHCGLHGSALQAARFVGHAEIIKILQAKIKERGKLDTSLSNVASEEQSLPKHIELEGGEKDPYRFLEALGGGHTGQVGKVECLVTGSVCARKTISCESQQKRWRLEQEVKTVAPLNHVHIVKILGSYSFAGFFYILLHPVATCDLKRYMKGKDGSIDRLARWIGCLARGLAYLHNSKVKHKDIKPANLLIDGENILYTDFDLAHTFQSTEDVTIGSTGQTVSYSAPEVAGGRERSLATDVFSLGCVYVEMLTILAGKKISDIFGKEPGIKGFNFRGTNNARATAWVDGLVFKRRGDMLRDAVRLTKLMISEAPDRRPDANTLARDLESLACSRCVL